MFKKGTGFTLIELLISIAIIAVLSAIGIMIYSTVMRQGRDSKRQSDLKSIQSALEQYFADQSFYPTSFTFGSALNSSTGNPRSPIPGSSPRVYMNTVPSDNPQYTYTSLPSTPSVCDNLATATNCLNYCLYAQLENPPSPLPTSPANCPYPSGYNAVVTPP